MNRPINRRLAPGRLMSPAIPSAAPRQRPVLGGCGMNRPINRRLAPGRLMSPAIPSAEPRQRPVLGGCGLNRTKTGGLRRAG
jgi:hypothetical protein